MFKRFILATDLSVASNALVDSLEGLKTLGAEECLLVLALPKDDTDVFVTEYRRDIADMRLQFQKELLEEQGYSTETRIVTGPGKSELNRIAKEEGYDLIVTGAEKYSLTSEIFSGSLAYDIMYHAEKPLLIQRLVKDPVKKFAAVTPIGAQNESPVLFATDFSENSETAFEYLQGIVAQGFKHIILYHVHDKRKIEPYLENMLEEFRKEDFRRLDDMKRRLAQQGDSHIEILMQYGHPAMDIIELAADRNVQLILMGSQGSGFVRGLFLGSVSHNVARQAPASVLLIPARHEEA